MGVVEESGLVKKVEDRIEVTLEVGIVDRDSSGNAAFPVISIFTNAKINLQTLHLNYKRNCLIQQLKKTKKIKR